MKRTLLTIAAVMALLVPPTAFAVLSAKANPLSGRTGPGLSITVTKAGKKVTRLRPGRYTITVSDRSSSHDFVLTGPGIRNRRVTGVGFTGRRSITVTLRRGRYEYYCSPHRAIGMQGFLRVR
jgi:plastocyanin